jgi:hypothetical protein
VRDRDRRARSTCFFDGLELVEPWVVPVLAWRPDPQDTPPVDPRSAYYWAGIARKA